jgi:hypothetical protein
MVGEGYRGACGGGSGGVGSGLWSLGFAFSRESHLSFAKVGHPDFGLKGMETQWSYLALLGSFAVLRMTSRAVVGER